jgi:hypothetical protein
MPTINYEKVLANAIAQDIDKRFIATISEEFPDAINTQNVIPRTSLLGAGGFTYKAPYNDTYITNDSAVGPTITVETLREALAQLNNNNSTGTSSWSKPTPKKTETVTETNLINQDRAIEL